MTLGTVVLIPELDLAAGHRHGEEFMSDALGETGKGDPIRRIALIYGRGVALLLLAAGLWHAAVVLGMLASLGGPSTLTPVSTAGAVALLCVDLLAAVGLWIGATWGPVIWAVALLSEVLLYTMFSSDFGSDSLKVWGHAALFAGFLLLGVMERQRAAQD